MEYVKILATPEAYKLLTDQNEGENPQDAIQFTIDQTLSKISREKDSFSENCPLAVSAIWAEKPHQFSVILIYKHKGYMGLNYIFKPETFWADISTAIPVDFI
jgi:hypothetical protein